MYSLRVLIGGALLVLAQSTILRRSIANGTTSQNTTTTSSSLSSSTTTAAQNQTQVKPADEGVKPATGGFKLVNEIAEPIINARRKNKKDRSTSSSSGEKSGSGKSDANKESLDLSSSGSSSSDSKRKNKKLKASKERRGWRRWHRKCTPCPEVMKLKWRNPSISWICGGYQRARRSFKSPCMMYLRNCQDGTMFVKIHDHRCQDDDRRNGTVALRHGDHFFYDYRVVLSGDDSSYQDKSMSSSEESTDVSSTSDSD